MVKRWNLWYIVGMKTYQTLAGEFIKEAPKIKSETRWHVIEDWIKKFAQSLDNRPSDILVEANDPKTVSATKKLLQALDKK